jgi:16S rRNA processing protein RimM
VRGEVRLRPFTEDPGALQSYGTLQATDGRSFTIESARPAKDVLVVRFAGIADRDAAEKLRGVELFIPRELLPAIDEPETYYHADLVGLSVVNPDGVPLGTVAAVQNFGAGDLIEVKPPRGPTVLLPFTAEIFPAVDIANGRIVAQPPEGAMKPSPLAGEGGEAKPSRVRGASQHSPEPLTRPSAGQGRQRATLSRKGRG